MRPRYPKCAALLLALYATAHAQFSRLAVTDDASQVYFVMTPPYSGNIPYGTAIFRISGREIERVAGPVATSCGSHRIQYVGDPQISGDAGVFSSTEYCLCPGALICNGGNLATSAIVIGGNAWIVQGETQISRNGRFASSTFSEPEPVPSSLLVLVEYLDLMTGATSTPPSAAVGSQSLTNDGALLCSDPSTGKLILWSPQTVSPVNTLEKPSGGIVNAQGTWVIFNFGHVPEVDLRAFEIATGREVLLDHYDTPRFQNSISNDGSLVLYLAGRPAQAFLIRPDGTARRQLTNFPGGVSEAVLSGNGQTVIAIAGPRILSIDVDTGAVRELLSAPPACGDSPFSPLTHPCTAIHR